VVEEDSAEGRWSDAIKNPAIGGVSF